MKLKINVRGFTTFPQWIIINENIIQGTGILHYHQEILAPI